MNIFEASGHSLPLPEVELPKSGITAEPKVPDEPMVHNKSQATKLARRVIDPRARFYANKVFGDLPSGTVVLMLNGEIIGAGKTYDEAFQDAMKPENVAAREKKK